MGTDFCKTLFDMSDPGRIKYKQALDDIESLFPEGGPADPDKQNDNKSFANLKNM